MFSPPNIVFIKNFDFENPGHPPRNKYMIVLLKEETNTIVVSLTTSRDKVPAAHEGKRCVVDAANGVHFYFIPQGHPVGKNGFAFPENTWIQFYQNIRKTSLGALKQKYLDTNNASFICELRDNEYSDLLYCIYKSQFTPRGIKKAIMPIVEKIEQARFNS